jgi:hypothetical protein
VGYALKERIEEAQRILKNLALVYTCHGFRGDPARLKLAMLTAYFDESGLAPSEQFCAVAGFVGNEAQWSSFIADWIPALGHHRRNLHMTKLRWNRRYEVIASDLARLGKIPHRYNLSPVRVGLWHRDVIDLVKGKINETYANPYVICALTCIGVVLQEVIGPDDEIMFIFDLQKGRRAQTMETLHQIVFQSAKMDRRVKDIDFRPHETTVCLDPADYYAYGFRENQVNREGPRAKACLPIADSEKGYGGILGRHQIEELSNHYVEHGMIPGSNWRKISTSLVSTLLKAGWNERQVDGLKNYIDEHNRKGDWA